MALFTSNATSLHAIAQDIVALLAITNPLGAVPVFLNITARLSLTERRRAAVGAALAVLIILTIAAVIGKPILRAFGISLPAFQAAGGVVILLMGLEMLRGLPTKVQHDDEPRELARDRVPVPLAMPLLAGPGSTTTITPTAGAEGWRGVVATLIGIGVVGVIVLLTLRSSGWLGERIGPQEQRIFLRFMGLILAAVGAKMALLGVHTFGPSR
jgi:multiple antibiotic resistance protein